MAAEPPPRTWYGAQACDVLAAELTQEPVVTVAWGPLLRELRRNKLFKSTLFDDALFALFVFVVVAVFVLRCARVLRPPAAPLLLSILAGCLPKLAPSVGFFTVRSPDRFFLLGIVVVVTGVLSLLVSHNSSGAIAFERVRVAIAFTLRSPSADTDTGAMGSWRRFN